MRKRGLCVLDCPDSCSIEVEVEKSGKPTIRLHGGAKEYAEKLEIEDILITISHCRAYATATAIAIRG